MSFPSAETVQDSSKRAENNPPCPGNASQLVMASRAPVKKKTMQLCISVGLSMAPFQSTGHLCPGVWQLDSSEERDPRGSARQFSQTAKNSTALEATLSAECLQSPGG